MILGKVIGTVWATRKDARLERRKLMLVRPYAYYEPTHDVELLVAVDMVDAGVGDDVVVCLGSPARWSLGAVNLPVDAAVMAVVDRCQHQASARTAFGGEEPAGVDWV